MRGIIHFNPSFAGSGVPGIDLDANSDFNRISGNDFEDLSAGGQIPVQDAGTGNCRTKNSFTMTPCP